MTNSQLIILLCHSILLTLQTRSLPSNSTESSLQSGHPSHFFAKHFPCFWHLKRQSETESLLQICLTWKVSYPTEESFQSNLPYMDLHIAETSELLFNMFGKFDWSYIISWSLHKVSSKVLTLSVGNTSLPGFYFSTKQHHAKIRIINICKRKMLSASICSLLFGNVVSLLQANKECNSNLTRRN